MDPRRMTHVLLAMIAASMIVPVALAEPIWVVMDDNALVNFDSATPANCTSRPITALFPGDEVVGIDYRPRSPYGQLYALTVGALGARLVVVNPATGEATAVGPVGLPIYAAVDYGMDFNPVVDRIRVVGGNGDNFRVNPDTGTLTAQDTPLSYDSGDPHSGFDVKITAAAYSNNNSGVSITRLYVIDSMLDILAFQDPPNSGILHSIGPLGLDASAVNGFDISGQTGIAYVAINFGLPVKSYLGTVNLSTGAATGFVQIGCGTTVKGLSVTTQAMTDVLTRPGTFLSLTATPSVATTSTLLSFGTPLAKSGKLGICDVQGRRVRARDVPQAATEVTWDLTDDAGRRVPPGLYFVRLVTRGEIATTRVVVTL